MSFNREGVQSALAELAQAGIYLGTSSWKYPGWCGQLYDDARYVWRKQFSESRFNRLCLEEYAEVFKTVSVDAAYYTFPSEKYLSGLVDQVPPDFQFAFKVTDEITIKHFPNLTRFGARAGQPNPNFLNPDLFERNFLRPCEPFKDQVGLLMFEFSKFYPRDFSRGREIVAALDTFLGALPRDWPYGVEIRNRNLLQPEYFEMLRSHGVAHVSNNWQAMPPVQEQRDLQGRSGGEAVQAARFLLTPGRKYQDAVAAFAPYTQVKEPDLKARKAGAQLIADAKKLKRGKTFVFVNNRLEGNALVTIQEMLRDAGALLDAA